MRFALLILVMCDMQGFRWLSRPQFRGNSSRFRAFGVVMTAGVGLGIRTRRKSTLDWLARIVKVSLGPHALRSTDSGDV